MTSAADENRAVVTIAPPEHWPTFAQSALFVDLYELTMGESYWPREWPTGPRDRPRTSL